jgi:hypothetical protein
VRAERAIAGAWILLLAACATERDAEIERLTAENARLTAELREAEAANVRLRNELGTRLRLLGPRPLATISPDELERYLQPGRAETPGWINDYGLMRGMVVAVDGSGAFLRLSIGRADGVKPGDVFTVFRDHEYVAKVEVLRVEPDFSAASVIPELQKSAVRVGDQATARF